MADSHRIRISSESSTSSSDSSMIDAAYAAINDYPDQNLIPPKNHHSDSTGRKSSSCRCSLAVVSLVISLVCLALMVAAGCFVFLYKGDLRSLAVPKNEEVCMPCGEISPSPLAESDFSPDLQLLDIEVDEQDGETEICCARTPAQYAALFKLILKRQEEMKKLSDIFGSRGENGQKTDEELSSVPSGGTAVSAHLLTKPMSPQFIDEDGQTMQQWKSPSESSVSHTRQGLKFHDHKIYIQTPGLYFVYCQILFNRDHTSPELQHPAVASHYVKRHSLVYPSSSGILLKARHTRGSGPDDRHSSYVGGLFFLHAGDQLFVQVSDPELVSYDDRASFFGLFRVGN